MDETSVSVGGRWNYLYRAVDRNGKSVHSLLCEDRTIGSAQEFFRQAVKVKGSPWPEKINLDGNAASHLGLRLLGEEDSRWQHVTVRARRYLNNLIEQDHRAIKQRSRPMLGLKSFHTPAVTFSGIELAHRIRKRQFTLSYEREGRARSLKDLWDQALSDKSVSDSLDTSPPPLMHQISRRSRPRLRARGVETAWFAIGEGCTSGRACTFRSVRRAADTGITAIALTVGRSSFPWGAFRTSLWRAPGRDATQRGTSLKRASILRARSRRCVESLSTLSDQIGREPSYRNESFRPKAAGRDGAFTFQKAVGGLGGVCPSLSLIDVPYDLAIHDFAPGMTRRRNPVVLLFRYTFCCRG
jgi:hypothetical protein